MSKPNYQTRLNIPLEKELVTKVLRKLRFKSIDDYVNMKLQEDLSRLT
jgi:hypothetical protein